MLKIVKNMRELDFPALMRIYEEGNREYGLEFWPELEENQQILNAEQDFHQYLREIFFPREGSVYCLWQAQGRWVSALRLEPYRDGLLLNALETCPQDRGRGYARNLVLAVQKWLGQQGSFVLYSHVHKRNEASLAVHRACGFAPISDNAVYADGSVLNNSLTLRFRSSGT